MSRSVSLTFRAAMFGQATDETPVVLMELAHPDIAGVARLSSDPTERLSTDPLTYGTQSNGETYLFCPMSIQLPDDIDERAPTARFTIENVGRELIQRIRGVTTPGTCRLCLVLASSPDDIEIEYPSLDIRSVQFNAATLTVELGLDALDTEPFPAGIFAPSGFPGLF